MPLHRRAYVLVCLGLTVLMPRLAAQAPSLDEIVAKYLAAKGGAEKLRAVTSVKTTGRLKGPAGEVPVTSYAKRPNMMRRETSNRGQTFIVGFDGQTVWALNPMISPQARAITGPQADMARQDATDF